MITNKKHIMFITEYCSNGANATDAYKKAYPGVKESAVAASASRLLKKADIASEINKQLNAQRQALAQNTIIEKTDMANKLYYIVEKNIDAFPPSALKAIEILNKMYGFNEADKIEHSGGFNLEIPGVKDNE